MSTTQLRPLSRSAGSVRTGTVTLVLGILFTASVALVGLAAFGASVVAIG